MEQLDERKGAGRRREKSIGESEGLTAAGPGDVGG